MAIQQIRGYRTMNSKNKLIDDFTEDAEIMGFKCDPVLTVIGRKIVSIDVLDTDKNPVLEVDFENRSRIFPAKNVKADELDQYSWLFSRASELLHGLKEA